MVKYLPGVLGALLIVLGVAMVWLPAALVVAGGFLLLIDNQIPTPRRPKAPRRTSAERAKPQPRSSIESFRDPRSSGH